MLSPKSIEPLPFNIEKLYDVRTGEPIEAINPGIKGQAVIIEVPYKMDKNWIMRRKK